MTVNPIFEIDGPDRFDYQLPNPLAQPGIAWHISESGELPPAAGRYPIRYSDPGGILRMICDAVGPATGLCILGDNVAGVASWRQVPFAAQYRAVTEGAAIFPCGTMYYLRLQGPDAVWVLDALTPKDMTRLAVGRATFVLFTTPDGTVDTEAVALRIASEEYLLSIGGSTREPKWLREAVCAYPDVSVSEADVISFNIKGPGQLAAMQELVRADDRPALDRLRPFDACPARTPACRPVWILRTLIGMEMWAGIEAMRETYTKMLGRPDIFTLCGWDMVNTFRVECDAMVFGLCPLDLHEGTTLWEVGQAHAVNPRKEQDYVGKSALQRSRPAGRLWLCGLEASDPHCRIPAVGDRIVDTDSAFAGYITTAAFSPKHGRPLAFAHLSPSYRPEQALLVHGEKWTVRRLPFGSGERSGQ
jgi:glycine cleavage system aminomethyltransferase T